MIAKTHELAVIFDFGNVVARFDYARATHKIATRIGKNGDELLAPRSERA